MLNNIMALMQNKQLMEMFSQNFSGKSTQQQLQTLLNMAEANGKDIHKPIISKKDFDAIRKFKR